MYDDARGEALQIAIYSFLENETVLNASLEDRICNGQTFPVAVIFLTTGRAGKWHCQITNYGLDGDTVKTIKSVTATDLSPITIRLYEGLREVIQSFAPEWLKDSASPDVTRSEAAESVPSAVADGSRKER